MEQQLSKELRLLGMTRDEVATKIGVTKATLCNWILAKYPISPVGVRKLTEIGVTKKAIKEPAKKV